MYIDSIWYLVSIIMLYIICYCYTWSITLFSNSTSLQSFFLSSHLIFSHCHREKEANAFIRKASNGRGATKKIVGGPLFKRGVLMVDAAENPDSEMYGERARKEIAAKEYVLVLIGISFIWLYYGYYVSPVDWCFG